MDLRIKKGSQGLYYTIDGREDVAFDIHFPLAWVLRDISLSKGALNCSECRVGGKMNGVIVSYCINCVTDLMSLGEQCGCLCIYNDIACNYDECCFKTYLKDVNLWEIGDERLFENENDVEDPLFYREVDSSISSIFSNDTSISNDSDSFESLLDCISNNSLYSDYDSDSIPDLIDPEEERENNELVSEDDSIPDLIEVESDSELDNNRRRRWRR